MNKKRNIPENPLIYFENDSVGRLKKQVRNASETETETDEILARYEIAFPVGKVPPIDRVTLHNPEDLEPYLKESLSKGRKSVGELPQNGPFTRVQRRSI